MNARLAWAVYVGSRGQFIARPFREDREGFWVGVGGPDPRERAHRLADLFNAEQTELRAAKRARRQGGAA